MAESTRLPATVAGRIAAGLWLLGLAIAAYLTFEHYTAGATLACSNTGVIDCEKVTSSPYATFASVPVALLGLLFFAAGSIFALFVAPRLPARISRLVGMLGTGVGMLMVLWLVAAEFQLQAICLWCTAVHLITAALFVGYVTAFVADS